MRGQIVAALAYLAIPLAFISPFLGLLAYCWLSYMRPTDMAWGIGHITFGLYTAVALFAGLLFRLRLQFFKWSPITWILFVFWSWWGICTYMAYDRGIAAEGLTQISRVFLICLVTTGLCVTKDRLRWVIVAIAGSLLFHGTKLGILGIATGGSRNVNPIGGLMSGNNENAIALNMALPFAVHFALNETKRWRRWALWTIAALTVIAIVCTYSRGGFLGMAAAGAVLLWHSRARWFGIIVVAPVLLGVGVLAAPEEWKSRIGGIDEARTTDQSAQFRLMAWGVAAEITMEHPIVGIGPENFYSQSKKFPRPATMHDMEIHNTYLELSSSLGLTGLAAYFVLVGTVWWTVSRVRRDVRQRDDPRLRWFDTAATATQASILSFLISSTFGSLANFELMYHVCILGACLPVAFRHETNRLETADMEAARVAREAAMGPDAVEPGPSVMVPLVPVYATSRYDLRPEVPAGLPDGLPNFRCPAPAVADVCLNLPPAMAALLAAGETGGSPPVLVPAAGAATRASPAGGRVSVFPAEPLESAVAMASRAAMASAVPSAPGVAVHAGPPPGDDPRRAGRVSVAGAPPAGPSTASPVPASAVSMQAFAAQPQLPPRRHTAPGLVLGQAAPDVGSSPRASRTSDLAPRPDLRASQTGVQAARVSQTGSADRNRADHHVAGRSSGEALGTGTPAASGRSSVRVSQVADTSASASPARTSQAGFAPAPAAARRASQAGDASTPPAARPGVDLPMRRPTAQPGVPAVPARMGPVPAPASATPAGRATGAWDAAAPAHAAGRAPAPSFAPVPAPSMRPSQAAAARPAPAPVAAAAPRPATPTPDDDPSPSQLADMFIDPYGTVGADEIEGACDTDSSEGFIDTSSDSPEEPAAPRRPPAAPAPSPWMSSAEMRALERPAATARPGRRTNLPTHEA